MPRRYHMLLLATLAAIIPATALAQKDLKILKPTKDGPPPEKILYSHLMKQAKQRFDERRKEIANLKTPEDFKQRQARIKQKFIDALGGFPKKTPLNGRITGKMQKEDYRIEKVVFESRPNHHVTAILYLPSGKGPFPGVLVPCGHSKNGKAAETYQRVSILLAKNGFAVLCYDPIGQGERNQLLNKMGRPAIPSSTSEHTMVGVGALLVGKSAATYRIWDGIRSMDYLASRPEVDAKRLGCTGNSGGGTLTAYLMALDDRILAAAPSCYITSLERLFETIGPQDAEQNITGQVAFGMEHADYVTLRAPKPTLILTGTRDFFDIDGAWQTFREAKLLYGLLGYGERVSLFEYNDPHGFSLPRRQAAVRWMRRWLMNKNDAVFEPKFDIFTDEQLQCTRTGQVLSDLKGKSAFHVNAAREKVLSNQRMHWQSKNGKADLQAKIRELIAVAPKNGRATPKHLWERANKDHSLFAMTLETEPGLKLPALVMAPKGAGKSLVIIVSDQGAAKEINTERVKKLVRANHTVMAVDLRGWGELQPKRGGGLAKHFGDDWREAFLGIHLNRPLLGQRVNDLLAIIAGETPSGEKANVQVIGIGAAGPVALHAAALDERIAKVTIEKSIRSWADVVHMPMTKNQLSNAVPNALAYYDLPDLRTLIAPRQIVVGTMVDPMGRVILEQ